MNNCNNNSNNNGNCIAGILRVILALQQNASPENGIDSCDRPLLGGGPNCLICNTRPIMLYTCCGNGIPWAMPTSRDDTTSTQTSPVFRVEKLENNCATCRVLAPNPDTTSVYPYVATNSLFTMDLDCCCVIRCLQDTYIESV